MRTNRGKSIGKNRPSSASKSARLQLYQAGDAPPHVPKGPDRPVAEQAPTIDVEPDGRLERKVEEDLQTSSESNLLSRDG